MFKIFIRRPVLSIVVSLVIAFIGILSLFNLPITQFPSISPPKVNVIANYPGATRVAGEIGHYPFGAGLERSTRHEIHRE